MAMAKSAKKLIIKPFKEKPKLPDNYEEIAWNKLQHAIDAVAAKEPMRGAGREELYGCVENLCLHKRGGRLYSRLKGEVARHTDAAWDALLVQSASPDVFLGLVETLWYEQRALLQTLRAVFLVLDKQHVARIPGLPGVFDLGLGLLRTGIKARPEVERKLQSSLLALYAQDRTQGAGGDAIRRRQLANLLGMLSQLQLYDECFGQTMLSEAAAFYAKEGESLASDSQEVEFDAARFVAQAQRRLQQVKEQVAAFLDPSSLRPLLRVVEDHMVRPHTALLLGHPQRGMAWLVEQDRAQDLRALLALLSRLGSEQTTAVKVAWAAQAKALATALATIAHGTTKDQTGSPSAVQAELPSPSRGSGGGVEVVWALLEVKAKLDRLLFLAFDNDDAFKAALKDALEGAVNSSEVWGGRLAELMAKFADGKLRGTDKALSEADAEAHLDRLMVVFRLLHGKDVFGAFYKRDFAKRLLSGRSPSQELERCMLGKLKAECGAGYTAKLEGMLKDLSLGAGDLNAHWTEARQQGQGAVCGVELEVRVLTAGYWPSYPPAEGPRLPPCLARAQADFLAFYSKHYQGRRLSWQHGLGGCVVKAHLGRDGRRHELEVNTYQAVTLVAFNGQPNSPMPRLVDGHDVGGGATAGGGGGGGDDGATATVRRTYGELRQLTGLADADLKRTLQSLACGKVRVLVKEPRGGKEVKGEGDVFYFDARFPAQKLFRIKISAIHAKEAVAAEAAKTYADVSRDRGYAIDAAVVRVMKARKTLPHTSLMAEVFAQLPFPCSGPDVKKRVESLIERDYLERDEDNPTMYNYLA